MTTDPDRLHAALADRYRIERELGAGGMATVYLATDLKHQRKVAVKVLRPELAAALGHDRFLREITTTANLRHPHILPLFDSGRLLVPPLHEVERGTGGEVSHDVGGATGAEVRHDVGGATGDEVDHGVESGTRSEVFLFYVMPYVEGESLRDRLSRERQLPLDDALQIAREVLEALSYAHAQGIVHRDVKPENILLESGHAVVADFGIARAIGAAGGDQLTATGMAIGTPAYMSPEQSAGESDIDGRSDVYSLACVLYELLAGEPPYTGSTPAAVIAKRLGTPVPRVRVLRDSVPDHIDRALRTAMQRTPADRFATAAQFADALEAEAAPRHEPGMDTPTGGPARRNSRIARRVVLGVIGAITVGALGWWTLGGERAANDLDPDLIAVMPFRVGGDPAIAYLRESMLDLLNARVSGETGPRTVEPRTTLSAWRRAVDDDLEDLSERGSRELAAQLGAGRVLLGSAVAVPGELTVSGTLLRVRDGSVVATGSVDGSPDSIAILVNRLTAQLLSLEAGESRERLEGLVTTSLDALQEYLAGRKAYRRGDYFEAMELYGRAFGRDSNFAQAAFGLLTTNAWIGTVFTVEGFEVLPTVWRLRDRLSARDLGLVRGLPFVGPNYPGPSAYADIIVQAEDAAIGSPDSPEHWLLLGQMLSKYGAVADVPGWLDRAADALDRAIALDSSFALAVEERLYTAMQAHDSNATRRYATLLEGSVLSGYSDDAMLWAAAVALGDSAGARRWRSRVDESSRLNFLQKLVKIPLHSVRFGLPLSDAHWANATLLNGSTRQERGAAFLGVSAVAFAEGRLGSAPSPGADPLVNTISQALMEAPYRPQATELAAMGLAPHPYTAWLRRGAQGITWPPLWDCYVELLRVTAGDTSDTRRALGRLRDFATLETPPVTREEWEVLDFRVCPLLLETLLEGPPLGEQVGGPYLDSLEAVMRDGPRWLNLGPPLAPVVFANFTIARLREAQGDIPRALAAIRRRENYYYPPYLWTLTAFLRQEGRLAALAGDTAGALRAYDHYLTLRTNPDPPFQPQRDSVVAERVALLPL